MNEFAHEFHKRRKPPATAPDKPAPARKRQKPMKRVSSKRAKLMREVGPERQARKQDVGECMICRKPFAPQWLDADEIARGAAREACLSEPLLTLYSCRKCHTMSQDWPIAKRIAALIRWTIDRTTARYNELRGTAPSHVTGDDVAIYLMFKKPIKPKRKVKK